MRSGWWICLALIAPGCGAATARPPNPPERPSSASASATPFSTRSVIVATDDDPGGSAKEVFERAAKLLDAGEPARARRLFDRVVAAERAEAPPNGPPSALARSAAYDAALASEMLEASLDARDRYRALALQLTRADGAAIADAGQDLVDAQTRRARLDVELEDDADLAGAAAALAALPSIEGTARAEATSYAALAKIHAGELDAAERMLAGPRRAVEVGDDGPFPPPAHAAAVHFAAGELLRARASAITFVPVTPDFGDRMETRCQRILDAEAEYIESIKTRELRWAVRAGLRVASLYIGLHDDLLAIPPPKSADTEARKALFRGAMRLRYRILLEKGLGTLEKTVSLEASTGVKTVWLEQTKRTKEKLEATLAEEKGEIAKLPYTEAQLTQAFDDLAGKGKSEPGKPTKKSG
jgi:hypothetical protein